MEADGEARAALRANGALHVACQLGDLPLARRLLAGTGDGGVGGVPADPTWTDGSGRTCFFAACRHGRLAVARWLHGEVAGVAGARGVGVWRDRVSGQSPLHAACLAGQVDVVRWLCSSVAEAREAVEEVDRDGKTPFALACLWGQLDTARYLFENVPEIRVDKTDKWGKTPLMMACMAGHVELAKWLYESAPGARSSAALAKNDGRTPFHVVCCIGRLPPAQWLYDCVPEARCTVTQADNDGKTPFESVCDEVSGGPELRTFHVALWLASLSPVRPWLRHTRAAGVRSPQLWEALAPLVARETDMRAVEMTWFVRWGYEDTRSGAAAANTNCAAWHRHRVVGKVALPVFREVTIMLAVSI